MLRRSSEEVGIIRSGFLVSFVFCSGLPGERGSVSEDLGGGGEGGSGPKFSPNKLLNYRNSRNNFCTCIMQADVKI